LHGFATLAASRPEVKTEARSKRIFKIGSGSADSLGMDSSTNEPIRLSDGETQMLTRALVEAQAQADAPKAEETDTQLIRRAEPAPARKTGNTQLVSRESGNMIF